MTETRTFKTSWGWMTVTASAAGVTSIDLSPSVRTTQHGPQKDDAAASIVKDAQVQLLSYLDGERRDFALPIDWSAGTSFQRKVWKAIARIPYGRVRSYQWVAMRVGGKQYARAVGMALGANPVPIVVPCHRIIAHDGSLGGFSCGLPMKRRLLGLEGTLTQLRNARQWASIDGGYTMKAVIQRVTRASVEVDGQVVGRIGPGLLVLLGVAKGDAERDLSYCVEKVQTLRMFSDDQGKMNRSLREVDGALLVVSQFTLLADTTKGRRPGFDLAAPPEVARALYEDTVARLRSEGLKVETGVFGAHMQVELLNDGPVTFIVDSRKPGASPDLKS